MCSLEFTSIKLQIIRLARELQAIKKNLAGDDGDSLDKDYLTWLETAQLDIEKTIYGVTRKKILYW
jgi:hypothetical protein